MEKFISCHLLHCLILKMLPSCFDEFPKSSCLGIRFHSECIPPIKNQFLKKLKKNLNLVHDESCDTVYKTKFPWRGKTHGITRNLFLFLVTKLCPLFWDPMDSSPPGSSAHGISQPTILEWVVISFFRGSSGPRDQTCVSCLAGRFFTTEPPGMPVTRNTSLEIRKQRPWSKGCP